MVRTYFSEGHQKTKTSVALKFLIEFNFHHRFEINKLLIIINNLPKVGFRLIKTMIMLIECLSDIACMMNDSESHLEQTKWKIKNTISRYSELQWRT